MSESKLSLIDESKITATSNVSQTLLGSLPETIAGSVEHVFPKIDDLDVQEFCTERCTVLPDNQTHALISLIVNQEGVAINILGAFKSRQEAEAWEEKLKASGYTKFNFRVVNLGYLGVLATKQSDGLVAPPLPPDLPRVYANDKLQKIMSGYQKNVNSASQVLQERLVHAKKEERRALALMQERQASYEERRSKALADGKPEADFLAEEEKENKRIEEAKAGIEKEKATITEMLGGQNLADIGGDGEVKQPASATPPPPSVNVTPEAKQRMQLFKEQLEKGMKQADARFRKRSAPNAKPQKEDAVELQTCLGACDYLPTQSLVMNEKLMYIAQQFQKMGFTMPLRASLGETQFTDPAK